MDTLKQKKIDEFFTDTHYKMIAVGKKAPTIRKAIAEGKIVLGQEIFTHVKNKTVPKGDVLALAEIAGVMGAKQTANLLPLCHPLPLEQVVIKTMLNPEDFSISAYCYVMCEAKTGVEMEALHGVNAALLCIYDLCKVFHQQMSISSVRLLFKSGGKQGIVKTKCLPQELVELCIDEYPLKGVRAAVVTISDRASKGQYEDKSGKILVELLSQLGIVDSDYHCIADDAKQIVECVKQLSASKQLIITTGGTGIGPRDVTVDCLSPLYAKEIPGFGELLRHYGANFTQFSWLSRSLAGKLGESLVINLPGSTKAVKQSLMAIEQILPHALTMIKGEGHD
jgi:cyclic pyranopterin phosphate synthase